MHERASRIPSTWIEITGISLRGPGHAGRELLKAESAKGNLPGRSTCVRPLSMSLNDFPPARLRGHGCEKARERDAHKAFAPSRPNDWQGAADAVRRNWF